MSAYAVPQRFQAFDANGDPLAGGKVYTYEGGTSTPATTYANAAQSTPNANPVVLDANGYADIFIPAGTAFKFVVKNSADVEQYTVDGIEVPTPDTGAPVSSVLPAGSIVATGRASAPTGYLMCDGSAVSRSTYADLFAAISTAYGGGDGSTTFNLPDLRQRFPLGKAASGTGNTLAATGGAIDHTHTVSVPAHTHSVPKSGWTPTQSGVASGFVGYMMISDGGGGGITVPQNDNTSGSGGASTPTSGTANPPFLVVNFIIKT